MKRRSFLSAAGGLGAAAVMVGPWIGRSSAATFGVFPGGTASVQLPEAQRAKKVLEIFLYGGLSAWETLYLVRDYGTPTDPDTSLRNTQSYAYSMTAAGNACGNVDMNRDFAMDANGASVELGPFAHLLHARTDVRDRMRLIVQHHTLEPHEAAVPLALTGRPVGQPSAAGLGAHIQRARLDARVTPDRASPHAYVFATGGISSDNVAAAALAGNHGGSARPVLIKTDNAARFTNLLGRSTLGGNRANHDALVAAYHQQYESRLTWPIKGRVRSNKADDLSVAFDRTKNADAIRAVLTDDLFTPQNATTCGATERSLPHMGLTAARRLLTHPTEPASYVCVSDTGLYEASGGGGYDTHTDNEVDTATNFNNISKALLGIINAPGETDPTKISLDDTLIILNTEFGRTPWRQGSNGRNHHPYGYVTAFIGGPITTEFKGVHGAIGRDGRAIRGTETVPSFGAPSENRIAALLAMGFWPFAPEGFNVADVAGATNELDAAQRALVKYFGEDGVMRVNAFTVAIVLAAGLAPQGCSCGNDADLTDGGLGNATFDQCDADPPDFVKSAFLALDGRRARSQAEVDVYADIFMQVKELGGEEAGAAGSVIDPREVVARAIMNRPEFELRWLDVFMDALHVQRTDVQSEVECWNTTDRSTVSPALATAVRDQMATQTGDGGGSWTMLDLARSAIALDDLTPMYRAQLFSMVAHPIPAANVPDIEAELARREDFGSTFDSSYLHRDVVCLGCHTSETSVTDNDEAELDRHWPTPGSPERAVYGNPMGVSSEKAHAAFRVDRFVVQNGSQRPWGWATSCGRFATPSNIGDDIAGVDGKLGSVTGMRSTVYTLEQALARGFTALRGTGVAADEVIADPDKALAWLVTLKMTEDVWRAATGTSLTIANYFPRNEAARDLLYSLANRYAQSGFSLKTLLVAIVTSDYFARLAPDAACGESPYTYPNVFDPWVIADSDETKRKNGPGDAVTAIDARTLMSSLAFALEWGAQPGGNRFPDFGEGCTGTGSSTCQQLNANCNQFQVCCTSYQVACQMNGVFPSIEVPFQQSVGTFLRNSERGFRGLDFQARLAWEDRYGACARPGWVGQDFIDGLVGRGAANPSTTVADVMSALKDRLINEPTIEAGPETDALTAIVGPLDASATAATVDGVRRVCGALIVSPQFLLQGIAGRGGERPILTPGNVDYVAICGELATAGIQGHTIMCGSGNDPTLTVTKTR